jgi:hypothetical protein
VTPAARHGRHRCSRCRIGSKGATGGQHRQTRGEEAATTVVMTKRRAYIGGVEHRLRRLLARWNTGIPCMWFRRKEAHCRSWTRGGLSSSWGSAVIRQSSSNTPSPLSCRSYSASSLGAAPQSDRGSPAPAPLAGSSAAGSREARRRQIEGGPPLPDDAPPPQRPHRSMEGRRPSTAPPEEGAAEADPPCRSEEEAVGETGEREGDARA